jgi:hypothetical protein
LTASLYLGYVFLELRCSGVKVERSIIFPRLAEHENVRAGRALEYIISDAPGMIAGFLSQSYCCTQSVFVLVTIGGLKKAI